MERQPMRRTRHGTMCCTVGFAVLTVGAAIVSSSPAGAQAAYPERVIRIVTVTLPGAPGDLSARLIGDRWTSAWGQRVVVEPKVGAGGSLAAGYVAKAAPDGYTLFMSGDAAIVTNLHLYKALSYDPQTDLAPVSQVAF